MRVPFSKIYRAFPELDRFDDAECKRFVLLAKRHKRLLLLAVGFASALVGLLVAFGITVGVATLMNAHATQGPRGDLFAAFVIALVLAQLIALPMLSWLVSRDVVLRRTLRKRIDTGRCSCGYTLLGLVPVAGRDGRPEVQCPECGLVTGLDEQQAAGNRALSEDGFPKSRSTREGRGARERERIPWHRASVTLGLIIGVGVGAAMLAVFFGGAIGPIDTARAYIHDRVWIPVGLYLVFVVGYIAGFIPAWILNRVIAVPGRGD